ncbi:putative adhesin [Cellulomonas sp.]|uniref:putative adhesin n=1 Tax=Cellulomonas sp. TaxID=40001 RepID=UPI00338F7AE1
MFGGCVVVTAGAGSVGGTAASGAVGAAVTSACAESVVAGRRADGSTVFAGHGEFRYGSGSVTVPEGTTLNVHSTHGRALSQACGLAIELGGGPSPVTVYGPGSVVPNYTLRTPAGLTIARGSTTVEEATPLSPPPQPGMGVRHWAACTRVR